MSVFLSYSSNDTPIAALLEDHLRGAGIVVVRDKEIMRGGGNWKKAILPRIPECDQFLLLWSASAQASAPVAAELGRAFEFERTIVPIRIDDTLPPLSLKNYQTYTFTLQSDGLAEILDVVAPLRSRSTGPLDADLRSALATYRNQLGKETSAYQALYPGEEMATDTVVPLDVNEGLAEIPHVAVAPLTVSELLRPRGKREQILLAGHPGAGKSTTLRYLAHKIVADPQSAALPVLARCVDFRPSRHRSFEAFLYEAVRDQTSREVAEVLRRHRVIETGNMSVLIDGLDELPAGATEVFLAALSAFLESSDVEIARIILTTRFDFLRMHEESFTGWRRFSLQPLTPSQVETFVSGWFQNPAQRSELLARLQDPRLAELASRPFLLGMMCLVFRRGGDLGPNRSELYEKAISYLESRHAEQTTDRISRIRREIMFEIALRSLQMGTLEIDRWTAAGLAASKLASNEEAGPETFSEVIRFLNDASRDVGILQSSMGRYSFIHRSFQEYMASRRLSNTPHGEGILVEHAGLARWEEPIRLYVGSCRDASSQARVLRSIWGVNQALALRALTDATMLPPGFAREILRTTSASERVRMLVALRDSLRDVDTHTRRRIAIETAAPLLQEEKDSEVLYNAIQVLRWVDPADDERTLWTVFGTKARQLRDSLLADAATKFKFVALPGGITCVGDNSAIDEIEKPSHEVHLSSFSIMAYQLTNLAYEAITGRQPSERSSISQEDAQPAVHLSWFDAHISAFRIGCRLPTEAEWEYAARGGSSGAWCFGDDESLLRSYANYEGNPVSPGRPWAVGSGKPNAFGLFDMHGNVWEWCSDWLAPYDVQLTKDPRGPTTGTARVRRGGGHSYHARGCRSAFRWGNDPEYSYKDIGARFVLDEELTSRGW